LLEDETVLPDRLVEPLVLVVGEEGTEYDRISAALTASGYRVAAAPDVDAGLLAVRRDKPAAVLAGGEGVIPSSVRRLIGLCRLGAGTPIALLGSELARVARQEHVPSIPSHPEPAALRATVDRLVGPPSIVTL
jgi:hypothetical protein